MGLTAPQMGPPPGLDVPPPPPSPPGGHIPPPPPLPTDPPGDRLRTAAEEQRHDAALRRARLNALLRKKLAAQLQLNRYLSHLQAEVELRVRGVAGAVNVFALLEWREKMKR